MKKTSLLLILFALLLCGCARTSGVSQAKYDEILKEMNELQEDYDELLKEYASYRAEKQIENVLNNDSNKKETTAEIIETLPANETTTFEKEETTITTIEVPTTPKETTEKQTTTKETTVKETTIQKPSVTLGQKNALKSAEIYLSFMAFSYEGLISQLEYEGYSYEECVYAATNCGADWNKQALRSVKNYLDFMPFSYNGLIKQLEYDKYTNEQAKYAVDNCGADWNEQAVKSAKNYLSFMAFSKDSLISQLEYDGFTHEQALYGVSSVGY